jgi:hypothetical protein
VNDGKDVKEGNLQVTTCMFCYTNLVHVLNPSTKERKGFVTYYKTYEIIVLKKQVNVKHALIFKKIEEQVNG